MVVGMRNLRWTWSVLLLLFLPVLSACQDHYNWHQKQTIIVDTPSGEVTGSSVVFIKATFGSIPFSENQVWYGVIGEATVVEVAPGRYLFALLAGSEERYYWAMRDRIKTKVRGEWLKLIPTMKEVAVLNPKHHGYQMLVTFDDINDPKSVRQVDPNNLEATFGPGFDLKEITLQISNQPITEGMITPVVNWIDSSEFRSNPTWRNLPKLSQITIRGLKEPRKKN